MPTPTRTEQVVVDLGERVTDASFVIDRMLDRVQGGFGSIVDRKRIAAAGHALGATTTYVLTFITEAPTTRIRAAVTIGGSLAGDAGAATSAGSTRHCWRSTATPTRPIPSRAPPRSTRSANPPKFFVTLLGADGNSPFATADDPALQVVEETTLDFFSAYLARSNERAAATRSATARWPRSRRSRARRPVRRRRQTVYESFATVWEAIADAIPDATAVVQGEPAACAWRELEDHAARLAAGLSAEGIGAGAHVALFLFNCPEYMECLFACSKLRALSANVNFRYEAGELAALLENADAEVLVFHRSLGERVAAVRDRLPKLRVLIEIDDGGDAASRSRRDRLRRPARRQRAAPAASNGPATTCCSGTRVAPPACRRACSGTRARCSTTARSTPPA